MRKYKCFIESEFVFGEYKLVPIRYEDRFEIMKWRNEQIYHLRQPKPLTEVDQEFYFRNVISGIFEQEKPSQILFSFLKSDKCIGYGGLVHINWIDKNAEISFIMDTRLESTFFHNYWSIYLKLIERLAFQTLFFHKLFVFAFDLRPHLYDVLICNNYSLEARLKEHCNYNDKYVDVIIHSKFS